MNIANVKVNHVCASATGCKPITSGMAGVTVTFEYDDPTWNSLNKTAVFTAGKVTRDVLNSNNEAIVPTEVLQKAGERLYVGVYGTDDNGKLVIPTTMTQVGMILPGAKPSGDSGTGSGESGGPGGASVIYNETTGELIIAGSGVTYNEDTGELLI